MRYTRHLAHLAGLITSLAACGGAHADHADATSDGRATEQPGSSVVHTDRLVCPTCAPRAGGETSDFGDGSDYFPGADGAFGPPDPCAESREASRIDAEAARALGFGAALDALETTFELSFRWSPNNDLESRGGGGLATGYTPETRLSGATHVDALQHLTSTLEGCEDRVVASVATSLDSADGALSIAGQLRAEVATRGVPYASGRLDLSGARGTLELDPPSSGTPTVGYVSISLYFFPKGVRTGLSVAELDPRDPFSDEVGYSYRPIDGHAPIDACSLDAEPTDFDEPIAALGDASLSDRLPEFVTAFRIGEVIPARWRDGTETTVQLDLGQPYQLCATALGVSYQVPFRVSSADGRVDVSDTANGSAYASADEARGWVAIDDQVIPADTFPQRTGIHGVDFGGLGAGLWHTEVYTEEKTQNLDTGESPYHGAVTVEGVDDDGHVIGIPGVTGVIEKLTW
jgi:hypothetical protein